MSTWLLLTIMLSVLCVVVFVVIYCVKEGVNVPAIAGAIIYCVFAFMAFQLNVKYPEVQLQANEQTVGTEVSEPVENNGGVN